MYNMEKEEANRSTEVVDVVVIGAGLSGLSSAKLLTEYGLDVRILEARDRVGGRTYTKRDKSTYQYVDLGGSYVGPTQNRIFRLAKQFGIDTYTIYSQGDFAFYSNKKCKRFQTSLPNYTNPLIWLDMNHLLRTMDAYLQEISLVSPWDCPHAEEWDNTTTKEFFDRICWTSAAKEFGRSFINLNVAMEAGEVSLLWFLWYVKNCGGVKRIWEVDGGAQEMKFVGGSMRISECMAEKLGDKVKLNSPVNKIRDTETGVTVETMDGTIYKSRHLVLAVAPSLQMKIHFEPPMPSLRYQLIQRLPMGSCIKNQTWYHKPFWRTNGFNGFCMSPDEPVGNTVDDCRPGDSLSSVVGFILGDQARKLTQLSREERKQLTCEYHSRLFGSKQALSPVYYEDFDWLSEEYSGGCYTSTYPPGVMTRYGREIRKPVNHIYFAGTETATEWTGYMDGAVQAGERAAREILHAEGCIAESEIWQEEPESKEYPAVQFEYSFKEKYAPTAGQAILLLGTLSITSTVALIVLSWKRQDVLLRFTDMFKVAWMLA